MASKEVARRSESRDLGLSDVFDRWLMDRWMGPESGSLFCPVDIEETDKDFRLTAELPGLKREDIHITLENGVMTISGEKGYERKDGGNNGYRSIERRYGRFTRSFTLPSAIKTGEIRADFKDGVLEVIVPKSPEAQPRRIEIAAGPPPKA